MNKLVYIMIFVATFSLAQTDLEPVLEFIAQQEEVENVDISYLRDELIYLQNHPLNLNKENVEVLLELGLLNELQYNELLLHLTNSGMLLSLYELQAVKHWQKEDYLRIKPFVFVDQNFEQRKLSAKELLQYSDKQLYLKSARVMQVKRGFQLDTSINAGNTYAGTPYAMYSRFRMHYGRRFSLGFTLENDAGEALQQGSLPDFSSFHFYLGNRGKLNALCLGDYQLQFGQGLMHWTGYGGGKSLLVNSVKKNPQGIRPSTSVDESRFLRGAAFTLGLGKMEYSFFASRKNVSGRLNATGDTLLSLNASGYHRTTSELQNRKNVNESIYGFSIQRQGENLSIGIQSIYQSYNLPYFKSPNYYNSYHFRGKELWNSSIDYQWNFKNMEVFGELALTHDNQAIAALNGFMMALSKELSLSVLYRNYARDYHSFYNKGFSEQSAVLNEKGSFAALAYATKQLKINLYVDLFKFPWRKYLVNAPSKGREANLQIQYNWSKSSFVYLRLRSQMKERKFLASDDKVSSIHAVHQQNMRLHFQHKIGKYLTWKMRFETVQYRDFLVNEKGKLFLQDLNYRPMNFPVDISVRYALFHTDSYQSRIYAYENHLLNVFSIPAYYNKGSRYYVVLRWSINKTIDFNLRISSTFYTHQKVISSGLEEIKGNEKTDVSCQLRLKF